MGYLKSVGVLNNWRLNLLESSDTGGMCPLLHNACILPPINVMYPNYDSGAAAFWRFIFWRANNIVGPPNMLTNVFGHFWPFAYVINQDVHCVIFLPTWKSYFSLPCQLLTMPDPLCGWHLVRSKTHAPRYYWTPPTASVLMLHCFINHDWTILFS